MTTSPTPLVPVGTPAGAPATGHHIPTPWQVVAHMFHNPRYAIAGVTTALAGITASAAVAALALTRREPMRGRTDATH